LEVMIRNWMIFMDPPRHDIVRKAFMKGFTSRAIKDITPSVRAITRRLLHGLSTENQPEIIRQLAFPLPILVIMDILGIPDEDMDKLCQWSTQLLAAMHACHPSDLQKHADVALAIRAYFEEKVHT